MNPIHDALAIAAAAAALVVTPLAFADDAPAPPVTTVAATTTTSTTTTVVTVAPPPVPTTSTTTTTVPAGDWRCPQWLPLALDAGFTVDELATVDLLIFRESTCRPDAYNGDDPNGGSRGLLQVNGIWCDWWLQEQGVLDTCDDLFDPLTNLRAGKAIHDRQHGFGAWGL